MLWATVVKGISVEISSQQRTAEWFQARLGKVTASRVADVVATTKSGYASSRANYMAELVAERLTGKSAERFVSSAMRWGTDTEPAARVAYEIISGAIVKETGLVDHPRIEMSGASPDGLIGTDGLVEIKCPNTSTHIDTLLLQEVPERYYTQIQWQLACTDRKWCDFVSFDPRMPENMQVFVTKVTRDMVAIGKLETEVSIFLGELNDKVNTLISIFGRDK
ncbi:phage_rel_nuc, putative phage-type endonuclease [uncultured Caudovirales phage]|uniref:Phage_rel_nuc, putative phage-type endonuclease n=1 Tax=uncultured Caudovirales phage TaxID=2100421 RepID=A0A6J5PBU4_9CAUD|nr:phage_rel_nuc, putative phage-type endonuclease [uncultured Caudovirales phage]CAB4169340.1 phage_rel_nuc, putative phage-type endonuclease [uncultured Caudovirales phage]CAB4175856.1 phage_rel_nuc, putative phage-type endonuclease [uncultured Caudovirales phage]CAB4181292.1 phage_rel_nuc, putative phage-type endonuclease [uncultured Caudovirales phage]CAB4191573.1 phage_rel_nuc, putative phage-type endonuclease [uncultured Caudovirales phage]